MNRLRVGAALLFAGAFVACTVGELNPQPLPPGEDPKLGAGADQDAGATGVIVTSPYADAADYEGNGDAGSIPATPLDDGGIEDASTDAGDAATDGDAAIN